MFIFLNKVNVLIFAHPPKDLLGVGIICQHLYHCRTLAIGKAGAVNAALLAASILGAKHPQYHQALKDFRATQTETVLGNPDPRQA